MSSWLDLTDDKEATGFEPIPAGVYNLIVVGAEDTLTKNGDKRLKLVFSVADGDYAGRKIFEGYNLSGNPKAVEISRSMIKRLMKCAGKESFVLKDPTDLLNTEVAASVKVQPGKDGYDPKNTVSSFKPKVAPEAQSGIPF